MSLGVLLVGCFGGLDIDADTEVVEAGVEDTSDAGVVEGVVSNQGVYVIELGADPDPPLTGAATLHVRIGRAEDGAPVTDATLEVEPFMPAMGHGVGDAPEITTLGDGRFDAAWSYPMAGEWEVRMGFASDDLGADAYTAVYEVQ